MNIVISSIISLVIAIVFAYFCHKIAVGKGRGPVLWAILGLLFALIAPIIIALLPPKGGRSAAPQ